MAVFAWSIEKEGRYFGQPVRFGNTYHYLTDLVEFARDAEVAQQLIEAERQVLASDIRVVGWKSWGPTEGTEFANVMREDGVVDLPGLRTPLPAQYMESCALVVWPLPRSPVTNRKRWLRKFLRKASSGFETDPVIAGKDPMDSGARDFFNGNYIEAVTTIATIDGTKQLCTEDGTLPNGAGEVRPFYYTRQIGR